MPSETTARPARGVTGGAAPPGSSAVVTLVVMLLAAALVLLATTGGVIESIAAVGVAVYLTLLATLGATRVGVITLMGAFATAPSYKGLLPAADPVTPTDGLLVLGFALLLPVMFKGKLRVPLPYVIGIIVVFSFGMIATVLSDRSLESFIALAFWLVVMTALPVAVLLWRPSPRVIQLLAWTYVVGHLGSWAGGIATGKITGGRHFGMTNHPNYFAEAGIMAIALLIYLFFEHRTWLARTITMGAAGVVGVSVLLSGSRGATLVVAVMVVMIPIVERSAITGFLYALGGALVVAAAPFLLDITGNTSAIDRLLGGGTSSGSDTARSAGLETAWDRFWASPFFGDGLIDLFDIHNNMLEVAVGIGIFGLVGFLLVLFALARPLFGDSPHRRLCYTIWAYLGWGLLIPSLYDRTLWVPMCLAAICWAGSLSEDDDKEPAAEETAALTTTTART
ncbi:O-antigen ligase family protein [Nocardioides sp. Root190]|uniref:O-antigen ligase family protein n=1 Tax=Nocardioides sp. Root190 TaxID=1736488 RepID=UPI000AA17F3A|nr:O-antigen ligase family protein [Nocardioides sp. Root190]